MVPHGAGALGAEVPRLVAPKVFTTRRMFAEPGTTPKGTVLGRLVDPVVCTTMGEDEEPGEPEAANRGGVCPTEHRHCCAGKLAPDAKGR